jgi:NifU-like protein involved in Fe-S cluster formation
MMPEDFEHDDDLGESDELAIAYYQEMWRSGGNKGKTAVVNGQAFVMACPGQSGDVIYVFLHVEDGVIADAKWMCHLCDPWMQVAGDVACTLVKGQHKDAALDLNAQDFYNILGGESRLIAEHCGAALLTVAKAVVDYDVRVALERHRVRSLLASVPLTGKTKISDLGFSGVEGQRALRELLEAPFAAHELMLPRAKLQEWLTTGTAQDVTLGIQAMLENRFIERVKLGACGFPKSFEESLKRHQ